MSASTVMFRWPLQRGESAGVLCPLVDPTGLAVDATTWPVTARLLTEPGGDVLHTFTSGTDMKRSAEGVHLSLTVAAIEGLPRRCWLEVIVTDPNTTGPGQGPAEVSMIVHGPVPVADR